MGLDAFFGELARLVQSNGTGILLFVLFLLSIIQISPLRLNPWTWISRKFGASVTKAMEDEIGGLKEEIKALKEQQRQDALEVAARLDNVDAAVGGSMKGMAALANRLEEQVAVTARHRIVRTNDELLRGVRHTKENLDQSLYDIKAYESYCGRHPEFRNHMISLSIENIQDVYRRCMKDRSFLEYDVGRDGKAYEDKGFGDYLREYLASGSDEARR